jgi:RNA polymerase sigma factor (sigma-70 family)
MAYDDVQIINGLRENNEEKKNDVLSYLYKKYYPMALSIVYQNNGTEEEAIDVFQDSIISFYESVRNNIFRGDSSINTYLYSTIRNQWFTKLKKNKRTVNIEGDNFEFRNLTEEKSISTEDFKNKISYLLDQIGESCKNILINYYYDNCSMKEIMQIMGFKTEKSAKSQKYKCMQKLIELIDKNPKYKNLLREIA